MRKLYRQYGFKITREIGIGKYGRAYDLRRTIRSAEVVTVGEKVKDV